MDKNIWIRNFSDSPFPQSPFVAYNFSIYRTRYARFRIKNDSKYSTRFAIGHNIKTVGLLTDKWPKF